MVYKTSRDSKAAASLNKAQEVMLKRRKAIQHWNEVAGNPAAPISAPEAGQSQFLPEADLASGVQRAHRMPWWKRFLTALGFGKLERGSIPASKGSLPSDPFTPSQSAGDPLIPDISLGRPARPPRPPTEIHRAPEKQDSFPPTNGQVPENAEPRPAPPVSEDIFEKIEVTESGFRVVFPDGYEMAVPADSFEGRIISRALDEVAILAEKSDELMQEMESAAKLQTPSPIIKTEDIVGQIVEMPPAASGIRRFGVDLPGGRWVALNPTPKEAALLGELAQKGSLGKGVVSMSNIEVSIRQIEIGDKMVSVEELATQDYGRHSVVEGEQPPAHTEPERLAGPVEDLPIVAQEPKKAESPEKAPPAPPTPPIIKDSAQPEIHEVTVAHLSNISSDGSGEKLETVLVTAEGIAYRLNVSDEARALLRDAAEVAPVSVGVRQIDGHPPEPVCVMEEGVANRSFEAVFGELKGVSKHPDPDVQRQFAEFAKAMGLPSSPPEGSPAENTPDSEVNPFHHYERARSAEGPGM